MLNSFNLFLSLLSFWAIFMIASGHVSWLYAFSGVFSAGLVTLISSRLSLIEKNSEMLYLSLGFHRHFIKLFLSNFIPALILLFRLAFREKSIMPASHKIKNADPKVNISALISTINMTNGLLVTNLRGSVITIHGVEEGCFEKFNLQKIQRTLEHINDDNLV
jgi:hypothetical protein